MTRQRGIWRVLASIFCISFAILLWVGQQIYVAAPPIPERVVAEDARLVYDLDDIRDGRQVWQSIGGMQLGSIWGHGAYLAPDWSADWLHRESTGLLDLWARRDFQMSYDQLPAPRQATLKARLKQELNTNRYDARTGFLTVSNDRADVIAEVARHYEELFGSTPALEETRKAYAMPNDTVPDAGARHRLAAFYFWTSWASATLRPDDEVTYTNNFPHEPLIGNGPSTAAALWSIASVIALIAGIGWLALEHARRPHEEPPAPATRNPFAAITLTPSMKATIKYFYLVVALFLTQVLLGAVTAHYAVEGRAFYGFDLSAYLPYALSRTWHTQLGIFWIATAWLATGLFIAPALSGYEPKFQKLGVDLLFFALIVVVVGSFVGEYRAVHQMLSLADNFWFGHQGYEYVDLGRFWQSLLFAGLLQWLLLVGRALWPELRRSGPSQGLIRMVFISTVAIGLLYGASFGWGRHTALSVIEYWRWWVVHLWVEGFFEVFATSVVALIFSRLGLIRERAASDAVLFSTAIFLLGGILGTLHHIYFAGTPTAVIAFGAMFSALEVVPLALVGFEAFETWRFARHDPEKPEWLSFYHWPILFFVAVSFWNLIGAGLLGFTINPPISLYYVQGMNLTASHAHTALFGVYGMLGIGLSLFCLRNLMPHVAWPNRLLATVFWSLNAGLALMTFASLVPAGLYQAYFSVEKGYWYARSAAVIHSAWMETFVWMRVPGDVVFGLGAIALGLVLAVIAVRQLSRPAGVNFTAAVRPSTRE